VISVSALMRVGRGVVAEADTGVEEEAMVEGEEVMVVDATVTEIMGTVIAMEIEGMEEEIEMMGEDAIEVILGTETAVAPEVTRVEGVTAGDPGPAPGLNHGDRQQGQFPLQL